MKLIGDFFLTVWLWNITFAWFYPIVTGLIMFLIVRVVMRYKRTRSLMIAFGSQLFSYTMLTVLVVGGLIHGLCWEFDPVSFQQAMGIKNELASTISLGMLYALFQSGYFLLGRFIYSYNYMVYLIMVWISNALGVMMTYMLIKLIMFSYYV
jgi:hypothetical protein